MITCQIPRPSPLDHSVSFKKNLQQSMRYGNILFCEKKNKTKKSAPLLLPFIYVTSPFLSKYHVSISFL